MPEPTTSESHTKPHEGWVLVDDDLGTWHAGRVGQIIARRGERWPGGVTWAYTVRFPNRRVATLYHDDLSKWVVVRPD